RRPRSGLRECPAAGRSLRPARRGAVLSSRSWALRSLAERLDRGSAEAELVEDLRPVLQPAHERAAPGLEVELGGHEHGVARAQRLAGNAAAEAEEVARIGRSNDGAVRAQDEGVAGVGGFLDAGKLQVLAH